ncbi:PREDICTED: vacuolar protein sorting-associated protein 16 homolog [Dufourea novaeangliae]|uniref:Vacuolar protein sorting-associated protein 16 homolog n=1 Tax=Dufourea novaeangliae TaxID=178035 RepID=A0A154PAW8_DUFNO|nr:PREDICTED: vacuolar protein sorting-associated protein 16 homolog [Dufourea novaeangliae]KZC09045.1 Vacuolar protein sorting-associated protein 16 like protein [Dufourea novaeangliae]
MSAMLTADWSPLGRDVFFRKFELYPLSFQQEVSNSNLLVAAPYGGSIAITRNPKKFVKVQGSNKLIIYLYTSAGKLTATLQWSGGQLVALGWSQQEELLCVQEDGMIHIYDMFGTYQHAFTMGNEVKDTKVKEAKFFVTSSGTGIAVLTSTNHIFLVNNTAEPKVRQISEVPRYRGAIDCWCLVHFDRETRIFLSNRDGIFIVHQTHQTATHIPFDTLFTRHAKVSSVIAMAVSGNNRHIALYSDTGHLYIGSIDFKDKYCEHNANTNETLSDIAWCGTEAVVCSWSSTVMVVGRTAETIVYSYDGPVHLVTEIDGTRVLSSSSHELIQKVPTVVQRIFQINSIDPASYLLEASKQFKKRSDKADSYIDLVKPNLDAAIKACIDGASHEFDFKTQKLLMTAAKFGKGFSKTINPEYYIDMCRTLRVLNAVRHPAIGIPITYTQYTVLTSQVLLDRLVARRHYYLSIQIARHLQLPEVDGESRILAHWACYKVKQTQLDKEQIAEEIADKLGYAPGVSYSEIAKRAADCGRKQLAIKLIDYEPRAHQQVLLLLTLGEEQAALRKAVESGNTDLVYTVILHLRENMTLSNFQMAIKHCPLAMSLYIKYCQNHNRETLRDIYNQYDHFHAQAIWFITESYQEKNIMSREALLQSAQENFKFARSDTNAALTEEQIKLLRHQRSLEDTLHESIVGKSLHDTVKILLLQKEQKLADKLKSEYRISDRRYWWLRIQCLAELDMWDELEKLSKSKKSPIGYEPFIDQCLKYNKEKEAKKYLPKVKDQLRVKYLVKLRMLNDAVQIAIEQKDESALNFVLMHCDPSERLLLDAFMSSIKN